MVNPLRKRNQETGASISRKSQESIKRVELQESKKKGRCCALSDTSKKKRKDTGSIKSVNLNTLNEEEEEREKKQKFPCCFHIPLEIVMEGLAVFDIILYTLIALIVTFISIVESFTARQLTEEETRPIGLKSTLAFQEMMTENMTDPNYDYEYDEMFAETSTTLGPLLFNPEVDIKHLAETYSRVGKTWLIYSNDTYARCGKTYYKDFLLTHQMNITKKLFEEVTQTIIISCSAYIIIASLLLSCLCCFRGYPLSKIIVILLCYAQLFPSYAIYSVVLIKSQNRRLCILEHGIGPRFKSQSGIFWILGTPLFLYKPYEIFIWCVYIKRYFQNKEGALQDESYFSPVRVERRKRVSTTGLRESASADNHLHHAR